jgi:hypothetical protein
MNPNRLGRPAQPGPNSAPQGPNTGFNPGGAQPPFRLPPNSQQPPPGQKPAGVQPTPGMYSPQPASDPWSMEARNQSQALQGPPTTPSGWQNQGPSGAGQGGFMGLGTGAPTSMGPIGGFMSASAPAGGQLPQSSPSGVGYQQSPAQQTPMMQGQGYRTAQPSQIGGVSSGPGLQDPNQQGNLASTPIANPTATANALRQGSGLGGPGGPGTSAV